MKIKRSKNRVRELREAGGLKQIELASRAEVGLATLNRVEKWGIPCAPETEARLARALGCKVREVFPREPENRATVEAGKGLARAVVVALCFVLATATGWAGGLRRYYPPSSGVSSPATTNVTVGLSFFDETDFDHSTTNVTFDHTDVVVTPATWTITSFTLSNPGSGYTQYEEYSISIGQGSPEATFYQNAVDGSGAILSIFIDNGGTYGYGDSGPTTGTFDLSGGSGSGAQITLGSSDWTLVAPGSTNSVDYYTTNVVSYYTTNLWAVILYKGSNVYWHLSDRYQTDFSWVSGSSTIHISNSTFSVTQP